MTGSRLRKGHLTHFCYIEKWVFEVEATSLVLRPCPTTESALEVSLSRPEETTTRIEPVITRSQGSDAIY